MRLVPAWIAGLVGPSAALLVTWYSPLEIGAISGSEIPPPDVVETLRTVPVDAVLSEMRTFAVGASSFDALDASSAVNAAEDVLNGRFTLYGQKQPVRVPFTELAPVFWTRV